MRLSYLALDGLYVEDGQGGLSFLPLPPPDDDDVLSPLSCVKKRIDKIARKTGHDHSSHCSDGQTELFAAAVQGKSVSGSRAGRQAAKAGQRVSHVYELPEGPMLSSHNVALEGYSLHDQRQLLLQGRADPRVGGVVRVDWEQFEREYAQASAPTRRRKKTVKAPD